MVGGGGLGWILFYFGSVNLGTVRIWWGCLVDLSSWILLGNGLNSWQAGRYIWSFWEWDDWWMGLERNEDYLYGRRYTRWVCIWLIYSIRPFSFGFYDDVWWCYGLFLVSFSFSSFFLCLVLFLFAIPAVAGDEVWKWLLGLSLSRRRVWR